jgi:hypothetical protein
VTRPTSWTISGLSPSSTDLGAQSIVWGAASDFPAHYGDLTHPHQLALATGDQVSVTYLLLGPQITVTAHNLDLSDFAPGDQLFVGFCKTTGAPVSGTVVDQSVSAGFVIP